MQNASGNILTDSINWTLIQDEYVATGGERFMTIGYFYSDSLTTFNPTPTGINPKSYFYVDDVSVTEGTCNIAVGERKEDQVYLYPNPVRDVLNVPSKYLYVEVIDITGRIVKRLNNTNGQIILGDLERGSYLIHARDEIGNILTQSLIKY